MPGYTGERSDYHLYIPYRYNKNSASFLMSSIVVSFIFHIGTIKTTPFEFKTSTDSDFIFHIGTIKTYCFR